MSPATYENNLAFTAVQGLCDLLHGFIGFIAIYVEVAYEVAKTL